MKSKLFILQGALLLVLALAGCAQNIVSLSYPDSPGDTTFSGRPLVTVCVVDFENKREEIAIGVRRNGDSLLPRTPVERWIAAGMAEEFRRLHFSVIMAETLEEALGSEADFIVCGEAEEVWLTETSFARYTGTVRTSISLLRGNGAHVTKNSYSSVFSKPVLPITGVPQTLLDEALFEMLQPAVTLLTSLMR